MTVAAVVVTYRAPDALEQCLRLISAQRKPVERLIIVDNGGDGAARRVLDLMETSAAVDLVEAAENLGPAGGYELGLRKFLDGEEDYAWTVDDDFYPDVDCLTHLLEDRHLDAVRVPHVEHPGGERHPVLGWGGVLFPRSAVEAAGLPRADFFWWKEDVEYIHRRMAKHGVQVVDVGAATIRHEEVRKSPERPAWKHYYETRNLIYLRLYERGDRKLSEALTGTGRKIVRIAARESEKGRKLRLVLLGVVDGVTRRMGKRVPVP